MYKMYYVPLGTDRKALAFLPLFKKGLGDIPKSLGGKGGFQGGNGPIESSSFFPLGGIKRCNIIEIKKVVGLCPT